MNVVWSYPSGGQGLGSPDERAKRKHLALCSTDRRTCGSPEYHVEADDTAHRLACVKRDCEHKAHGGTNATEKLGALPQDRGTSERQGSQGHAREPKRPEAWQQESPAPSPVHVPQLPPEDDSGVGAGTQETVQAGARKRGRPRGSKDDPRRPRKNAKRRR